LWNHFVAWKGDKRMASISIEEPSIVFLIDDDTALRDALHALFRSVDIKVESFGSAKEFLQFKRPDIAACLLLDVRLPGVSGLDFQSELGKLGIDLPIIFLTGYADVPMGVRAMKAGAVEFFSKPFREQDLLDAVRVAIDRNRDHRKINSALAQLRGRFDSLTVREREVLAQVATGLMNKQIAGNMGISEITVKVHRGSMMKKMGARSLAELVRLADALTTNRSTVN
jgi:FixJ family two-component response regulator